MITAYTALMTSLVVMIQSRVLLVSRDFARVALKQNGVQSICIFNDCSGIDL